MRWRLYLVWTVLILIGACRCGSARTPKSRTARPLESGPLTIRANAEPVSFNLIEGDDLWARRILLYAVAEPLIVPKKGAPLSFEPLLSSHFEMGDDGRSLTFALREGVLFSDGSKLTVNDVKATFERANVAKRLGISEIELTDDHHLRLRFQEPNAYLQRRIAEIPVLKADKASEQKAGDWQFIGTGPYRVDHFVPGRAIRLIRSNTYRNYAEDSSYRVDAVEYRFVKDPFVAYELIKNGQIDIDLSLSTQQYLALDEQKEILATYRKHLIAYPTQFVIGFQTQKPPFDDARLRRAFGHLLDRNKVSEMLFGHVLVPSNCIFFLEKSCDPTDRMVFDPERADAILGEVVKGKAPAKTESGDRPIRIRTTIIYPSQNGGLSQLLVVYAEVLAAHGIELSLVPLEWPVFFERLKAGDFGLYATSLASGVDEDPVLLLSKDLKVSTANYSRYENDQLELLLKNARREIDNQKRLQILGKINSIVMSEMPFLPVFRVPLRGVSHKRIEGVLPSIDLASRWIDLSGLSIAPKKQGASANQKAQSEIP